MIKLNVNVNEKITISSLSVLDDYLIINFRLNVFKTAIFNEIFFEIKMKLSKSLTSFSTITCFFNAFFEIINEKKLKNLMLDVLSEFTFITINVNLFLDDNNAQFEKMSLKETLSI